MEVLVFGTFDILHWGHVEFLARAKQFGDVTVGLTSDSLATVTKRPPLFKYQERRKALERLGFPVMERREDNTRDIFNEVKPAFFICGNDWLIPEHLPSMGIDVEFLDQLGCSLVYTPRGHQMSASSVIERARASE